MTKKKVYPNTASFTSSSSVDGDHVLISQSCSSNNSSSRDAEYGKDESVDGSSGVALAEAFTVWKKSLVLNCKGFTVFDGKGDLVFRVDNYVAANKTEILLMDAAGKPLLTIRRKRLSWGENWLVYEGETQANPKYLVQKQGNILINNSKTTMGSLAHVLTLGLSSSSILKQQQQEKVTDMDMYMKNRNKWCKNSTTPTTSTNRSSMLSYEIEGSYAQRTVLVYDNKRQRVAEMRRKETTTGLVLGGDVFRLIIVRPDCIHAALAMAIVILLDQMFGS